MTTASRHCPKPPDPAFRAIAGQFGSDVARAQNGGPRAGEQGDTQLQVTGVRDGRHRASDSRAELMLQLVLDVPVDRVPVDEKTCPIPRVRERASTQLTPHPIRVHASLNRAE